MVELCAVSPSRSLAVSGGERCQAGFLAQESSPGLLVLLFMLIPLPFTHGPARHEDGRKNQDCPPAGKTHLPQIAWRPDTPCNGKRQKKVDRHHEQSVPGTRVAPWREEQDNCDGSACDYQPNPCLYDLTLKKENNSEDEHPDKAAELPSNPASLLLSPTVHNLPLYSMPIVAPSAWQRLVSRHAQRPIRVVL